MNITQTIKCEAEHFKFINTVMILVCSLVFLPNVYAQEESTFLRCSWTPNLLTIHGDVLPGGKIDIFYIEAYCRPGSTDREWGETVIEHTTEVISHSEDQRELVLLCTLKDGVTVRHTIRCAVDEVDFKLEVHNPTNTPSQAHWAQPCVRIGGFTGYENHPDTQAYKQRCFIFLEGIQTFMPVPKWAMQARYTPGQVWCPKDVPRDDVNPRPLSRQIPSNGLIGAVSADSTQILATAWEPYQELFQGVIKCIHSDFRIGGLQPGERKKIRGKLYLMPNNIKVLVKRYEQDFPEHVKKP